MTLKQAKFADTYLETGNATEAADRAYKPKNRNTAHAMGAENLRKPTIRAYLEENARDAASMLYKLSQEAKSEAVRLNASKDILDRTGYGEVKKIHTSFTEHINPSPENLSRFANIRNKFETELAVELLKGK